MGEGETVKAIYSSWMGKKKLLKKRILYWVSRLNHPTVLTISQRCGCEKKLIEFLVAEMVLTGRLRVEGEEIKKSERPAHQGQAHTMAKEIG